MTEQLYNENNLKIMKADNQIGVWKGENKYTSNIQHLLLEATNKNTIDVKYIGKSSRDKAIWEINGEVYVIEECWRDRTYDRCVLKLFTGRVIYQYNECSCDYERISYKDYLKNINK